MTRPTRKISHLPRPTTQPAPELRPNKAELEELISKVKDLVSQSPEKAAFIISQWTRAQEKDKKTKKGA